MNETDRQVNSMSEKEKIKRRETEMIRVCKKVVEREKEKESTFRKRVGGSIFQSNL